MGIECVRAHAEVAAQESAQVTSLLSAGEHLYAIASGEHHAFINSRLLDQRADGIRQLCLRDGKPLAHVQRCAVVVHADELKVHCAINLCQPLLTDHASTAAPKANAAR